MDITKATQWAVWGIGIAFAITLLQPMFFGLGFGFQRFLFYVQTILHDGALLLFFVTLRKSQ
jgi:hypothetical protein